MSTTKISVTIEDSALEWLRERARRIHGGNLSAAIAEAALVSRKQEALRAFLDEHDVPELTPSELDAVTAEWKPRSEGAKRVGGRAEKKHRTRRRASSGGKTKR